MFLGLLTLITALAISGVAVYYSVSGLAAIFAGAAVPIIIMGASLEIGKLVTASWLHRNWKTAPFMLKSYLMIATLVLMFITSMGIFGFLSRAHVVAQFMIKGKDERSVAAANNARKNQQKERDKLAKDIDSAQKEISKLQEIKLPLTTQIRKIETEVGPIKYIAEFMYGSNADKNMLEKAVTWMIIIIIFVFDPLAVLLLIAGQISLVQASEARRAKKAEKDAIKTEALATVIAHQEPEIKHEDLKPVIDQDMIDRIVRERYAEMMKQVEKGEITFEGDIEEKKDVLTDAGNNDAIPVNTVSEEPVEPVRVDDIVVVVASEPMASESTPINTEVIEEPKTEENTARWQELEEQVANLKKKEQYMMKVGNQQILVEKK